MQCHVGDGARALVHYKLAGVRQLVHVISGNYPRPIPASQAVLRPALETCGTCHSPTLGHGERTRTIREYAEDETNTETATTLTLHVGGPGRKTASGRAIHWHADPNVRIEYITTDADRQTIPFVRTINEKGETTEYVVEGTKPETLAAGTTRTMDCIDCHNAAAHRISPTAEQAVNRALADGRLNPALPFVRREAVRLLKSDYNDEAAASAAIESGFRAVYAASKASVDQAAVSQAITATQQLYRANVFPAMKVTWGVYRDNLGHTTSDGCFRCHDGSHVTSAGKAIEPIARIVTISSNSSNRVFCMTSRPTTSAEGHRLVEAAARLTATRTRRTPLRAVDRQWQRPRTACHGACTSSERRSLPPRDWSSTGARPSSCRTR